MTDSITLPREGEQMNEDFIERVWEEAKLLFLEGGEELIPTLIALAYSYGMDDEREACKKLAQEHAARYKVNGEFYKLLGENYAPCAATACDHIVHLIEERGDA
jgi:hypothetical protein